MSSPPVFLYIDASLGSRFASDLHYVVSSGGSGYELAVLEHDLLMLDVYKAQGVRGPSFYADVMIAHPLTGGSRTHAVRGCWVPGDMARFRGFADDRYHIDKRVSSPNDIQLAKHHSALRAADTWQAISSLALSATVVLVLGNSDMGHDLAQRVHQTRTPHIHLIDDAKIRKGSNKVFVDCLLKTLGALTSRPEDAVRHKRLAKITPESVVGRPFDPHGATIYAFPDTNVMPLARGAPMEGTLPLDGAYIPFEPQYPFYGTRSSINPINVVIVSSVRTERSGEMGRPIFNSLEAEDTLHVETNIGRRGDDWVLDEIRHFILNARVDRNATFVFITNDKAAALRFLCMVHGLPLHLRSRAHLFWCSLRQGTKGPGAFVHPVHDMPEVARADRWRIALRRALHPFTRRRRGSGDVSI